MTIGTGKPGAFGVRATVVATIFLLGSCASGEPGDAADDGVPTEQAAETTPILDVEQPTPIERYESGELTFGDPADEGFAPVEDLPIVELDDAQPADEPVEEPSDVLPQTPTIEVAQGTEVLSTVDVIDEAPTSVRTQGRDGRNRNDIGELVTLDDDASVACGNAEVALTAIDEGDAEKAAERQAEAARFAARSRTEGMGAWAESLTIGNDGTESGADATTLVAFLKSCSGGGYEL